MRLFFSLGSLTALQLAANFALQLIVLAVVGAGRETDAFVAAQAVPLVVFSILSVSMQGVWQPYLSVHSADTPRWRDAQGVAQGQVLLLFGTVVAVLIATADLWVRALFPGFDEPQRASTVSMTRWLCFAALLNGHGALLTTALRARERFVAAELVTLLGTLLAVTAVAITVSDFGVEAAVWANVARAALIAGSLYVLAGSPKPSIAGAWSDREMWGRMRPLLFGSSIYKGGPIIDRYWSSRAAAGGMTVYSLAQTGFAAVAVVLDRSICVPVVPSLARFAHAGRYDEFRAAYRRCIRHVTYAVAGIFAGLVVLLPWWPQLLALALNLQEPLATQMWVICALLIGYLHVAAAGTVASSAFYALGDTRTPVMVGTIGFGVGVVLKSVGFVLWGLPGLALATSVYYVGNMSVTCLLLERRIDARSA